MTGATFGALARFLEGCIVDNMPDVLDYSWYRPNPADLKAAGIVSVSRYLSWLPNGKVITQPEYAALQAVGISVILNWESTGTDYSGGYGQGHADGVEARRQARALGHPDSRPVIQSVDTGVGPSQALLDYQRGFNDGGNTGAQGFYGDAACADALFMAGLISVYWEANARGWPGDGIDDPRAALVQRTSHSFGQFPADQYDESDRHGVDYGQNPPPALPNPPPPKPRPLPPPIVNFLKNLATFLASLTKRPMRAGDKGPRVAKLNALLSRRGYKVSVDFYGPEVVEAVAHFKFTHKLRNRDGRECGAPCYLALLRATK